MQRHFFLSLLLESVYHLDSDLSPAWSRHYYSYPPATGVFPALRPRSRFGLWFRTSGAHFLLRFIELRNRAGRIWS
jgi:hypothetical protein